MLDRSGAESPVRPPGGLSLPARGERRRALVACAVLALALHAAFIGNIGGLVSGAAETAVAPMSVRTVPEEARAEAPVETAAAGVTPPSLAAPTPQPQTPVPRRARAPAPLASQPSVLNGEIASADSAEQSPAAVGPGASAPSAVFGADTLSAAATEQPASAGVDAAEAPVASAASGTLGPRPPLLAAGDEPPPLYRTQLPPPVTLHYQVRRGFLRGTGQIRWQPGGDRYRLVLAAHVGALTLLTQTSEGDLDVNGLAPVRFVDQRARRSAVAANFRRDDGRITFSGAAVEWPLLPGSQDRLSWMIQLAGIAAADPGRLVEGGRIVMVVVGARGDASVWTLRFAGRETIETVSGTVHAVKLVREGRSAYDTSAEIWLDPEHSYLPAHATLRNSAGASEYDLLLERVEPD